MTRIAARVLLVPDCHHPFVDEAAWCLALKVARVFDPSNVVILGDFVDFYAVSDHLKNPDVSVSLSTEVAEAKERLGELNTATPNAISRVYCAGNHEYRLDRYIQRNAPQLQDHVKTEKLLELEKLGWDFVPYKKSFAIGQLNITHDIGGAGRTAHIKAAQLYGNNIAIGHVHSAGIAYVGTPGGHPHVGIACGWLGDPSAIDYMHNDVVKSTWMHGIGVALILENGDAHCHFIPFVRGVAVVPTASGIEVVT